MVETSASRTALGVAWLRAAHQVLDRPLILEDPAALALFDPAAIERLRLRPDEFQSRGARALRALVVLRSRYTEDRLALGVRRGVKQYVVLGAGYDTFSVRQPEWARSIQITEVDQPATQQDKQARLEQAALVVPGNVTFLSVDFEAEILEEALKRGNVDPSVPTFFSWLGVTVYLTEATIDAVFSILARYPSRSEVIFTFAQPPDAEESTEYRPGAARLAEQAAAFGEPWRSYFTVEAMESKLRAFGFRQVEFLTPSQAEREYFAGRSDGLPIPRRTYIGSALPIEPQVTEEHRGLR